MKESDGVVVSSASAGGAEENDSARLQQLERKLADMAALFDKQQEMLTRLAEDGRGEESGGARRRGAIDSGSFRRREPAGTADLRTTNYRLGEAMYTRGLQSIKPVTELDRSATSSAGAARALGTQTKACP